MIWIFRVELIEPCLNDDTNNHRPLVSITFGTGPESYLNRTPEYFNFTTKLKQAFKSKLEHGMFSFVNAVPNDYKTWYDGALDHTDSDTNGYMFLMNFAVTSKVIFKMTIDNLCNGSYYLFSAYMANVARKAFGRPKPTVKFEVRNTSIQKQLLVQCTTGDISASPRVTQ